MVTLLWRPLNSCYSNVELESPDVIQYGNKLCKKGILPNVYYFACYIYRCIWQLKGSLKGLNVACNHLSIYCLNDCHSAQFSNVRIIP